MAVALTTRAFPCCPVLLAHPLELLRRRPEATRCLARIGLLVVQCTAPQPQLVAHLLPIPPDADDRLLVALDGVAASFLRIARALVSISS